MKAMVPSFEELGNPFTADCGFQVSPSSKDIMPVDVSEIVNNIESVGMTQDTDFFRQTFETREGQITQFIRKNKLPAFSMPAKNERGQQSHAWQL